MASDRVIENIAGGCESLGEIDLEGVSLDSGDPRLLNVSQMDLDTHVAMQPSAVAYYGSLLKEAGRKLDSFKRHYNRWEKKQWAVAKASVLSGCSSPSKILAADIEARFIVDNEPEIEKWEKQLEKLQEQYDTLSVWYEAWKQKSFSIREHANITEDERWNSAPSVKTSQGVDAPIGGPLPREGIKRVKEMIRKRREEKSSN